MGDTLRELVTRFGFETDKGGVDRFNQTIGGMKKQIVGLAGALGVGLGGRELLRFGTDAKQTEVAFKSAVSGIDGGLERVTRSIDKLLGKGDFLGELGKLGEIVTPQQGQAIAASFFGAFEDVSDKTLGTFETFLRAAVTLAAQTGGEVTDTFSAIFQAAREGVIDPLQALPGITAETSRQFQFITGLLGQIDPTNVAQLRVNMGRVREEIEKVLPDVEKFVQQNATDLLAAREASAKLQESMQTLGAKAVKALEEPLDILSQFVGKLNDGKGAAEALGESLSGIELPPAIRSVLEFAGVLDEEQQTPAQRERAARQEAIRPFLPEGPEEREDVEQRRQQLTEAIQEDIERARQLRQKVLDFFGGEESRAGGFIKSLFEFDIRNLGDQSEQQPVPVVVEQPGEPIIVVPPTPQSNTQGPASPPQREGLPTRRVPARGGISVPTQSPISAAISRLESVISGLVRSERTRTDVRESSLDVTVRHEGRVQTFPDLASFQRAFGDLLGRIGVEFEPSETTKAP